MIQEIQRYYADSISIDPFNNNGNVVLYADHFEFQVKVMALITGVESIECWNENEHLIPLIEALRGEEGR